MGVIWLSNTLGLCEHVNCCNGCTFVDYSNAKLYTCIITSPSFLKKFTVCRVSFASCNFHP